MIHIVATDKNGIIAKNNQIPWNILEDLKHFSEVTKKFGSFIIGSNTYKDILENYHKEGNVLFPDRKVVVVSREPSQLPTAPSDNISYLSYHVFDKNFTYNAVKRAQIIAGGAYLYDVTSPSVVYLTEVDVDVLNDVEISFTPNSRVESYITATDKDGNTYSRYSHFNRTKTARREEGEWLTSSTGIRYRHVICYL